MTAHPTTQERAEAVLLYSQGALQKHIAHIFNRPEPTIRRWIKKAGAQRGHRFRGCWPSLVSGASALSSGVDFPSRPEEERSR